MEDFDGRRVLVIDNNATNRLILRETLNVWGLECDDFSTPMKALLEISVAIEAGRPYSLVIVDGGMPEMNGFEAVGEIHKIAPTLPVVLLTSDIKPSDAARHRQAGFSGYGVKPVTRTELLHLVCDAMKAPENRDSEPLREIGPVEKIDLVYPMSILVAEDSADNRLLIQAYMKGNPHTLTFVEDGKAALDESATGNFGLILMDIQMPVMDGLHATRSIRCRERELGLVPVPIVALTANASPQDVEMSFAAGCNGHVSKPISKRKLLSTIGEYGEQPLTSDLKEMAQPAGMHIPPEIEEIVPGYVAARKKELPEMLALLASSDFERIRVLGHNMKGSGNSYGFPELTRLGAEVERLARQSDRVALNEQLTELERYLKQIEH